MGSMAFLTVQGILILQTTGWQILYRRLKKIKTLNNRGQSILFENCFVSVTEKWILPNPFRIPGPQSETTEHCEGMFVWTQLAKQRNSHCTDKILHRNKSTYFSVNSCLHCTWYTKWDLAPSCNLLRAEFTGKTPQCGVHTTNSRVFVLFVLDLRRKISATAGLIFNFFFPGGIMLIFLSCRAVRLSSLTPGQGVNRYH